MTSYNIALKKFAYEELLALQTIGWIAYKVNDILPL